MTQGRYTAPRLMGAALCLLLVGVGCLAPGAARAHSATVSSVIARISAPDMKKAVDVVSVASDPNLQRLLVVRIGKRWDEVDGELRRRVVEEWFHLWRDAMPNGIVGVVRDSDGNSLVGFDVNGKATLREHGTGQAAATEGGEEN